MREKTSLPRRAPRGALRRGALVHTMRVLENYPEEQKIPVNDVEDRSFGVR